MKTICKEEINYFILARGLFYVASVLGQFTEKGFRRLHDRINQKLSHLEKCQKRCSENKENDYTNWCPTCQQWRDELANSHRNDLMDWSKTRSWEWPRDFKDIVPLFARDGWHRKIKVINFTDLSTALWLWENCTEFSIDQNVIDKLRELRNGCFAHPPKMEVNDQKLKSSFNVIYSLFHTKELQNFVDINECLVDIENIQTATEIDWVTVKQTLTEVKENLDNQVSDREGIISSLSQVEFDLEAKNEHLKLTIQEQETHLIEIKKKITNRCLKWLGILTVFVLVLVVIALSLLIRTFLMMRDIAETPRPGCNHVSGSPTQTTETNDLTRDRNTDSDMTANYLGFYEIPVVIVAGIIIAFSAALLINFMRFMKYYQNFKFFTPRNIKFKQFDNDVCRTMKSTDEKTTNGSSSDVNPSDKEENSCSLIANADSAV